MLRRNFIKSALGALSLSLFDLKNTTNFKYEAIVEMEFENGDTLKIFIDGKKCIYNTMNHIKCDITTTYNFEKYFCHNFPMEYIEPIEEMYYKGYDKNDNLAYEGKVIRKSWKTLDKPATYSIM